MKRLSLASLETVRQYRYGTTTLWVLEGDLVGTQAKRLQSRVDMFFQDRERLLILDLREAGFIDSLGAAVLQGCSHRYTSFFLLGRPESFEDFPLGVRRTVLTLCPSDSLRSLLGAAAQLAESSAQEEKRRWPRLPAQFMVDLVLVNRLAAAVLTDISPGGGRLERIAQESLSEIQRDPAGQSFELIGLEQDPLGREIAQELGTPSPAATAVHFLSQVGGVGISFRSGEPAADCGTSSA
jgi:hypothetical protein